MEKKIPAYRLDDIKLAFLTISSLRLTGTAFKNSSEFGLSLMDIVEIIKSLKSKDFYKSMTTYQNSSIWQDVYHAKFLSKTLYLKFMMDTEGYLIVSLKEK